MVENHYAVLGLSPQASLDDVKKAYRSLVKQHHPDVVANTAENLHYFNQIKVAYETLTNPVLRRQYLESRWYYKSQGVTKDEFQRQTPQSILVDLYKLEQKVYFLEDNAANDAWLHEQLASLLSQQNIKILQDDSTDEFQIALIAVLKKIATSLPVQYYGPIDHVVNNLVLQNDDKIYFKKLYSHKKMQQKLHQYYWLGIAIAVVLGLALLYWIAA